MGENSHIEWTDSTFNPWIGCRKVSPGCKNCYAEKERVTKVLGVEWGGGKARYRTSADNWKNPRRWNSEAEAVGKRRRVFCASLSDWLDDEVPIEWLCDLLCLISVTKGLDWQLLTKRPENFESRLRAVRDMPRAGSNDGHLLANVWLQGYAPGNVWLGCTVEDQERAEERIPRLLGIPARVRFLSCEPLLGPLMLRSLRDSDDATAWLDALTGYGMCDGMNEPAKGARIDWVIAGGESGKEARPSHPDWFRALRTQCVATKTAFFFKQWGEWLGATKTDAGWKVETPKECPGPDKPRTHSFDEKDGFCVRVGKKAAGRLLDGVEWNELPSLGGGADL